MESVDIRLFSLIFLSFDLDAPRYIFAKGPPSCSHRIFSTIVPSFSPSLSLSLSLSVSFFFPSSTDRGNWKECHALGSSFFFFSLGLAAHRESSRWNVWEIICTQYGRNLLQVSRDEGNDLYVRFARGAAASFRGLLSNQSCDRVQVPFLSPIDGVASIARKRLLLLLTLDVVLCWPAIGFIGASGRRQWTSGSRLRRYTCSMQLEIKQREKMKRRRALQMILFFKVCTIVGLVAGCGVASRVWKVPFLWAVFCTGHSLQVKIWRMIRLIDFCWLTLLPPTELNFLGGFVNTIETWHRIEKRVRVMRFVAEVANWRLLRPPPSATFLIASATPSTASVSPLRWECRQSQH